MAETSGSRCDGQEYVTDWRMVYAAVGVVAIFVAGGLVWSLYAPADVMSNATTIASADTAASDAAPVVIAGATAVEAEAVEIVLPWAPLATERRLPPETTQPSPPDETEVNAVPESEKSVLASSDEADQATDADARIAESSATDQFAAELERAVTLDFNPIKATQNPNRGGTRTVTRRPSEPLTQEQQFAQLANPSELAGLPILGEDQCHKSAEEVNELARVSRGMASTNRNRFAREAVFSLSQELGMEQEIFKFIEKSSFDTTSVSPLVQILQVGGVDVRVSLVEALSRIEGPEASRALADRALFDLSREVRVAATESLKRRDRGEYRPRLLRAFRYPLPAAAFHAAETLVALGDADALPSLEELLDEPDPSEPFAAEDGTLQKTELVRVNHLRNCLLCHPRSGSPSDQVRGAVPTPGQPLPQLYYQSSTRDAVRAEVTYLRQDFSVMQLVSDRGPWPEMQRFDFLVRTRTLTEGGKTIASRFRFLFFSRCEGSQFLSPARSGTIRDQGTRQGWVLNA